MQYQEDSLNLARETFDVVELPNPSYDTDTILGEIDIALAPMGYFFGPTKINRCPKLKAIGSNTTGHPHIDVAYAKSRQIKVATLKYEHDFLDTITPTAELTWGLIIATTRNLKAANESTLAGNWNRRLVPAPRMLSRMTIGIVGLGRLGFKVAQIALAFGMKVNYYDPHVSTGHPGISKIKNLKKLVSESDIVTLHAPHEKETENLFDAEIFAAFRENSYFINTARGELVDHNALLNALKNGSLAGAGLDVFPGEFDPNFTKNFCNHPLWHYAKENTNLILTPHIGGSTHDAWSKTEKHLIKQLQSIINTPKEARQPNGNQNGRAWAIITARGGSKSIPLKNLAPLNGKPLIDYALTAASLCKSIERIICSTDNEEIANHCLKVGALVDRRPNHLAGDDVATVDVLIDFIERQIGAGHPLPEFIVLLEPTSPFVAPKHIEDCFKKLYADPLADSAQTVTRVASNSHAYNQRYHDERGSHFLFPRERKFSVNKQSKPHLFVHGNVRVMRTNSLMRNKNIFGKRSIPIEISKVSAMDVDGPEDLRIAEALIAAGLQNEQETEK